MNKEIYEIGFTILFPEDTNNPYKEMDWADTHYVKSNILTTDKAFINSLIDDAKNNDYLNWKELKDLAALPILISVLITHKNDDLVYYTDKELENLLTEMNLSDLIENAENRKNRKLTFINKKGE